MASHDRPVRISAATARRLAVRCQGLDGGWELPAGKEGVAQAIERLGYVQIDTIAVVERAHHHTLWSRHPQYTPEMLHELQAHDRRVFEYWTHAASFVPMRDYRYYLPRMRAHADSPRMRDWLARNATLAREIRERIRAEGPLASADFAAPDDRKRGPWWDWKPAKEALERLFWSGELMIAGRRRFQRLYDLTERVLPTGTDTTAPDPEEIARFAVRRLLASHGVAAREIPHTVHGSKAVAAAIADLVAAGEVTPVAIEGRDGETYYALTATLAEATEEPAARVRLHLLSPFDNLVIGRDHLQKLFGFDYKIECYTPAAKRQHGYFCLPILWDGQFVGRLDPKADRKQKTLFARRITLEPAFQPDDRFLAALAETLSAFAAFNGCERVVVEQTVPEGLQAPLARELDRRG
jgi:uncharacterized protein YcaQ